MDSTNQSLSLESMSKGLLKGDFVFKVSYYSFAEKRMNTPADGRYMVPTTSQGATEAICNVSMNNDVLSIRINDFHLDCGYFPSSFVSKVYPGRYSMSGEIDDDFTMLNIAFIDMSKDPRNHNHVHFIFEKGVLTSIGFLISEMDDYYRIYEPELNLYGEIEQ